MLHFCSSRWLLAASLSLGIGLSACSRDTDSEKAPANRVTSNDFESAEGWMPATPALTTERAHSGRFATLVSPAVEYSLGYISTLGKASQAKMSKLTVTGWGLLTGAQAKPAIVVQIIDPAKGNTQVFWQSLDLREQIKTFNTWTKVTKQFELPATIAPTHELRVYMWRGSSTQPAFLDDVEITKE